MLAGHANPICVNFYKRKTRIDIFSVGLRQKYQFDILHGEVSMNIIERLNWSLEKQCPSYKLVSLWKNYAE